MDIHPYKKHAEIIAAWDAFIVTVESSAQTTAASHIFREMSDLAKLLGEDSAWSTIVVMSRHAADIGQDIAVYVAVQAAKKEMAKTMETPICKPPMTCAPSVSASS